MPERFSNFSEQKKRDLRYHLGLLDDQAIKYGNIEDDETQKIECIREIESLTEALMENFRLEYNRVLDYTVHRVTPTRRTELKEALLNNSKVIRES